MAPGNICDWYSPYKNLSALINFPKTKRYLPEVNTELLFNPLMDATLYAI